MTFPGDRYGGNSIEPYDGRWYYSGRRPGYDPMHPGMYDSHRPGGFWNSGFGGRPGPAGPPHYADYAGYNSFGGAPPGRPFSSRCDEGDNFKQAGVRQRVRKQFVRRFLSAASLSQCQRECVEARDFVCRSFNYRYISFFHIKMKKNCKK